MLYLPAYILIICNFDNLRVRCVFYARVLFDYGLQCNSVSLSGPFRATS